MTMSKGVAFAAKSLVLVCLVAMVAWWGILVWGAEHHWLLAALQYAPYWALLVPLVLALAASAVLAWSWRLMAIGALLIALVPVMGLVVGMGDTGSGRVRFMTYNIKAYLNLSRPGGLARVAWEIAEHDPDIIVMQDAGQLNASGNSDIPPEVMRLAGTRQVYAYGQYIVASKLPMRDCEAGSMSYEKQSHTYVHCVVRAYGRDVDLITAHLLSPRDGLNALRDQGVDGRDEWAHSFKARMTQATKLAQVVAHRQRPLILAGDLNAPERSLVVQELLDVGLRDAFSAAGIGYGYSHGHSLKMGLSINRIDHILVSQEIGVADCFVGGKEGSDHRPVVADLLLNRD